MSNRPSSIIIDKEIRAMELDIARAQGSLKIFKSLKEHGIETIEIPAGENDSSGEVDPSEIVKRMEQVAKEMGANVVTQRKDVDESLGGK